MLFTSLSPLEKQLWSPIGQIRNVPIFGQMAQTCKQHISVISPLVYMKENALELYK